jgi:hypothetical protein
MDTCLAQWGLLILQDCQALIEALLCARKSPVIGVEQRQRPQAVFPRLRFIQHGGKYRQDDSQVFKKISRMKLQMQREALAKLNRHANEMPGLVAQPVPELRNSGAILAQ